MQLPKYKQFKEIGNKVLLTVDEQCFAQEMQEGSFLY